MWTENNGILVNVLNICWFCNFFIFPVLLPPPKPTLLFHPTRNLFALRLCYGKHAGFNQTSGVNLFYCHPMILNDFTVSMLLYGDDSMPEFASVVRSFVSSHHVLKILIGMI